MQANPYPSDCAQTPPTSVPLAMHARLTLLLAALCAATAFYLPGVAPKDFKQGEHVDIKVNKLTSTRTQLPYEYYSLPFCQPTAIENVAENLGEVLRGDRIMNSEYDVKMGVEETCKILCRKELTQVEIKEFSLRVEEDYRVHWVTDNLPSATKYVDETNPNKPVTIYDLGFPLGFRGSSDIPGTKEGTNYLNNHLLITIKYHKDPSFDVSRNHTHRRTHTHRRSCPRTRLPMPPLPAPTRLARPHASATHLAAAGVSHRGLRGGAVLDQAHLLRRVEGRRHEPEHVRRQHRILAASDGLCGRGGLHL